MSRIQLAVNVDDVEAGRRPAGRGRLRPRRAQGDPADPRALGPHERPARLPRTAGHGHRPGQGVLRQAAGPRAPRPARLRPPFTEAPFNWQVFGFEGRPYLGFPRSHDVHGDGSVVCVPAPGHTPGSIIVFVTPPRNVRYALVGDLVWQREGLTRRVERPWLTRVLRIRVCVRIEDVVRVAGSLGRKAGLAQAPEERVHVLRARRARPGVRHHEGTGLRVPQQRLMHGDRARPDRGVSLARGEAAPSRRG